MNGIVREMRLMTQLGQLDDGRLDRMMEIQPANKEVFTGARIRRWEMPR